MAFTSGQIITAAELNTVNSASFERNAGSATTDVSVRSLTTYFYATAKSGTDMGTASISGGWNIFTPEGGEVFYYRKENGSWVQKGYDYASDNVNSQRKASVTLTSVGRGCYKVYQHVRYCHYCGLTVKNADFGCEQGRFLSATGTSMALSDSDNIGEISVRGKPITAQMLNDRQVFTL